MKQGGRYAKKSAGFTIVETLIVFGVSAGLFLIAALYIGEKQAKTEFQVGVRDIQTQLEQVINQTESGYYGVQDKSCTVLPSGITFSTSPGLGTHGTCIFIGRAIVFNASTMYIYPIAGVRQVLGVETTNPVTARATVVSGSLTTFTLPNGITLARSSYDGGTAVAGPRGLAVLASMASTSGSQTYYLSGFRGTFTVPAAFANTIDAEKSVIPTANAYLRKKSVDLCMKSGGTNQSALITIGAPTTSSLAVHTEIKSGISC